MSEPFKPTKLTDETRDRLLAAASAASSAALDLIDTVREGEISRSDNVGGGEVLAALLDAALLVIEADPDPDPNCAELEQLLRDWSGE